MLLKKYWKTSSSCRAVVDCDLDRMGVEADNTLSLPLLIAQLA